MTSNSAPDLATQLHQLLLAEVRRRLLDESVPRLKKCLSLLTEAEVWHRPNAHSNSVGNLVLHLCGNARQWILHGLGGAPDHRQRQSEFDEQGPMPTAQLVALLDQLCVEMESVLAGLTPQSLAQPRQVQGFSENTVSVLVHVVEHFSYHTGQVSYYTKAFKDLDLGYYAGQALDITGQ
jgi:uncharacterized damage-inducible protein DinB